MQANEVKFQMFILWDFTCKQLAGLFKSCDMTPVLLCGNFPQKDHFHWESLQKSTNLIIFLIHLPSKKQQQQNNHPFFLLSPK